MLGYYVDGFGIYGIGDNEGAVINFVQHQPDIDTGEIKRVEVCNIKMDNECVQNLYDALGSLLHDETHQDS